MALQAVITTPANTGTGDSPKSAFDKINANFGVGSTGGASAGLGSIGLASIQGSGTGILQSSGIQQLGTGFFYQQSGAVVNRIEDRLFVGDAAINDGQGPTNPVSTDWLTTYQQSLGVTYGSMNSAQFAVLSTTAAASVTSPIGGIFGAQTAYTTQNAQNAVALECYAINNSATYTNTVYGLYIEGHRYNNVVNGAIGAEFDVVQRGSYVTISPYSQTFGQTVSLQAASGAQEGATATASFSTNVMNVTLINNASDIGNIQVGWKVYGVGVPANTTITSFGTGTGGTGTYNLSTSPGTLTSRSVAIGPGYPNSAAVNIQANPFGFSTGINFGSTSVVGGDGVNGTTPVPAITFAKNHAIFWYTSGGASTGAVYCTSTANAGSMQIQLAQGQLNVNESSSGGLNFSVSAVVSSVNYAFASGAVTGSPAVIGALGGDTNVDLGLYCAGTGVLKMLSSSMITANGTVATTMTSLGPTGSHATIQEWLTIKNSAGTLRYIPCY